MIGSVIRRLATLLLVLCTAGTAQEAPRPADLITALLREDGLGPTDLEIQDRRLLRTRESTRQFYARKEPHLLPAVRRALDRPLDVSRVAGEVFAKVAGAKGLAPTLQELQAYHREALLTGGWGKPEPLAGLDALEPEAAEAVAAIHAGLELGARHVERAMKPLSVEERDHLRRVLPLWLTRLRPEQREGMQTGEEDADERKALERCARLWARVDEKELRMGWVALVTLVANHLPALKQQPEFRPAIRLDAPAGPILLRGHGNDSGDVDAVLVIDFGGHDEFTLPKEPEPRPVRLVIDLGGDDLYLSRAPLSWGAALLGLSLHVDAGGDDDYRAPDWSLGCALGGHAALWDREGRDRYYGGLGAQGVGIFGTGLLLDDGGDDAYAAGLFCQGFGSTAGLGALVDRAGDDRYFAGRDEADMGRLPGTFLTFAQGSGLGRRFGHIEERDGQKRWRLTGQIPGGVGLLIDVSGNDRYEADVFGQGSAYWYSLGVLVDGDGNDRYRATWYGQGVGTHAAVGCVVDRKGDDWYFSRNTSQGCGHDFSAGILHDAAGNDTYRGFALCQGAGNASSGLGILIDEAGADDYRCSQRCWGFGARAGQAAPFGFFLDLQGVDRYEGPVAEAKDGARWRQDARGYGIDR
jgi:hypothetical protein